MFAHIYTAHLNDIMALGQEAHINTAIKHLACFAWKFDLIPTKEMMALREVLINLLGQQARDELSKAGGGGGGSGSGN